MANLELSDVLVPQKFLPYMLEQTAAKSDLVKSGIMQRDAEFDRLANASGGVKDGGVIKMPFWTDLSGVSQTLNAALTTEALTDSLDQAAKQGRGKAYSAQDLVSKLIDLGPDGDATAVVASRIADFWSRDDQAWLVSILKGVFAAASMAVNLSAIASEDGNNADDENKLTDLTLEDAKQLLGDRKDRLTAIAMHSATHSALVKQQLVKYILDPSSGAQIPFMVGGERIIVDDTLPKTAGSTSGYKYTTYLFGQGAIAWGEKDLSREAVVGGTPGSTYGVEYGRSAAAGESQVYFRRILLMHPRGVKYNQTSQVGTFPTQAELETGTNWTRVYEAKNVRIVAVSHNN